MQKSESSESWGRMTWEKDGNVVSAEVNFKGEIKHGNF